MEITHHRKAGMAATLTMLSCSGSAWAHHPMGGETPLTFTQGFLSGLGHPIIGLDHLAFIIAIGLLCAFVRFSSLGFPLTLVLATVLGAALQWTGIVLPYVEVMVAISVVVAGLLLFRLPTHSKTVGLAGLLAAVFHGLAYGEAVIGAEPSPLGAYLLGFSLIQMLIAGLAFVAGRAALSSKPKTMRAIRKLSAVLVGGIGLLALSTAALA